MRYLVSCWHRFEDELQLLLVEASDADKVFELVENHFCGSEVIPVGIYTKDTLVQMLQIIDTNEPDIIEGEEEDE